MASTISMGAQIQSTKVSCGSFLEGLKLTSAPCTLRGEWWCFTHHHCFVYKRFNRRNKACQEAVQKCIEKQMPGGEKVENKRQALALLWNASIKTGKFSSGDIKSALHFIPDNLAEPTQLGRLASLSYLSRVWKFPFRSVYMFPLMVSELHSCY